MSLLKYTQRPTYALNIVSGEFNCKAQEILLKFTRETLSMSTCFKKINCNKAIMIVYIIKMINELFIINDCKYFIEIFVIHEGLSFLKYSFSGGKA